MKRAKQNQTRSGDRHQFQVSSLRSIRHFIRTNEGEGQAHSPTYKSKSLSIGKLRLSDLEKQERQMAENASSLSEGRMTFGDALQIYRQKALRKRFAQAEAKNISWADCNFEKVEILVRGDEKTSTKNWTVRTVPRIPEMRKLVERLKAERPGEPAPRR